MRNGVGIVLATLASLGSAPAVAGELVAVKPGVMCAAPDALARLTLPNGDSRTHAASPRPEDLAAAEAGGCIDIPLGARVKVREALRNTSRVTYAGPGAPADGGMTVPNVDFQAAPDGKAAPTAAESLPAGLAVAQRIPLGDGTTLVVLLDPRLTPALQKALWRHGDLYDEAFDGRPALVAQLTKQPFSNARLALLSGSGQLLAQRPLAKQMAKIQPLQFTGLPTQAIVLMVDWTTGNPFYGPFGELLMPGGHGLQPIKASPVKGGPDEAISLDSTNHAQWRVVAARRAGAQAVEAWTCPMDPPRLDLRTYRWAADHWTVSHRAPPGDCREVEAFPDGNAFP